MKKGILTVLMAAMLTVAAAQAVDAATTRLTPREQAAVTNPATPLNPNSIAATTPATTNTTLAARERAANAAFGVNENRIGRWIALGVGILVVAMIISWAMRRSRMDRRVNNAHPAGRDPLNPSRNIDTGTITGRDGLAR